MTRSLSLAGSYVVLAAYTMYLVMAGQVAVTAGVDSLIGVASWDLESMEVAEVCASPSS